MLLDNLIKGDLSEPSLFSPIAIVAGPFAFWAFNMGSTTLEGSLISIASGRMPHMSIFDRLGFNLNINQVRLKLDV